MGGWQDREDDEGWGALHLELRSSSRGVLGPGRRHGVVAVGVIVGVSRKHHRVDEDKLDGAHIALVVGVGLGVGVVLRWQFPAC